ncbi:OB-fold domain-containing protein [Candidatus Gottesmanbacteria bacterium]|nr:OB-fold domain-containing protein [Candidatus Gottesmanbacteria bacterium]
MISPVKIWRNQKKISSLRGSEGVIVSWTMIRVPPSGFSSQAPYPVALVQLQKSRIVCQLVDWDTKDLHSGQKVTLVIRRVIESPDDGVIPYGVKAKPV